jgi:ABC-2 type transport system ATP-binding protein
MTHVIQVDNLRKTYRTPFRRKRVEALKDISFTVERGEVFGFLGPNGAGKTTSIRILMGLIAATSGTASILGHGVPNRAARARLGFLPEAPYFYEYLTVAEMLDLAGRLFGLGHRERRRRSDELIERVGLEHARNTPLKKYSKGMLQRAGIAQALINDPELVVFDEPMSGLDPIGRKDVRDIIESLREKGKTVFFSSHILADVELLSDRVAILVAGEMREVGPLADLVRSRVRGTEIGLRLPEALDDGLWDKLAASADSVRRREREAAVTLGPDADINAYVAMARDLGAELMSVSPRHETLEDLFLRSARARDTVDKPSVQTGKDGPSEANRSQAGASKSPEEQGSEDKI